MQQRSGPGWLKGMFEQTRQDREEVPRPCADQVAQLEVNFKLL